MAGEHSATKPQPTIVFGSVVTFMAVLFGGLGIGGVGSDNELLTWVGSIGTLVTGALNQAFAYYIKGQVVPVGDVGTYLNEKREPVEGPAAAEVERKQSGDP